MESCQDSVRGKKKKEKRKKRCEYLHNYNKKTMLLLQIKHTMEHYALSCHTRYSNIENSCYEIN